MRVNVITAAVLLSNQSTQLIGLLITQIIESVEGVMLVQLTNVVEMVATLGMKRTYT